MKKIMFIIPLLILAIVGIYFGGLLSVISSDDNTAKIVVKYETPFVNEYTKIYFTGIPICQPTWGSITLSKDGNTIQEWDVRQDRLPQMNSTYISNHLFKYEVSFTPSEEGTYNVNVALNNEEDICFENQKSFNVIKKEGCHNNYCTEWIISTLIENGGRYYQTCYSWEVDSSGKCIPGMSSVGKYICNEGYELDWDKCVSLTTTTTTTTATTTTTTTISQQHTEKSKFLLYGGMLIALILFFLIYKFTKHLYKS